MKKKFISFILVVALIMTMVSTAFATDNASYKVTENEGSIVLSDGSIIKSTVMPNGDTYLRQYVDDKLIEEAFIAHNSTNVVSTRYQDNTKTVTTLDAKDCITVHTQAEPLETSKEPITPKSINWTTKGDIVFENTYGRHVARVQHRYGNTVTTICTIVSGTYTVVSLAGVLVSALGVPGVIASTMAATIFGWLGFALTVAGLILSNKTYAAKRTKCSYLLTDMSTGFTNNMESNKYEIIDQESSYYNEIVWDGFNPATCWRDISFGTEVYWHLYSDMSWYIAGWYSGGYDGTIV